ncbi:hypothetical protein [uncultured Henriciella sp.]|uniref:hypothetical protein n=1 Tax=uncultured Henriciella sp. TaxID=1608424 RepID=UPI0032B126B3
MLALAQRDTPFRALNHTRVEHAREDVFDELAPDQTSPIARKGRKAFEEALHFCLCLEPARGKAFQPFLDDRGNRLITGEHIAMALHLLEFEANARMERPIAGANTRFHPVARLFGVLHPRMLANRGQQMLDQLAVGILAKLDRGRFQNTTCLRDGCAEFEMRVEAACKA